ncbi:MAG: tRNA lysidine(34) synthetase TilS [Prevotella sp.]|nr:tRNA lysidine(34) synthetase TilS [Prevotella sp.]
MARVSPFIRKVRAFAGRRGLLDAAGRYLVALSGGADSVCLLRFMLAEGYRVEAAHCNFRLRGEESDRDEEFCKALCRRLGVKLHTAHFDTRAYAEARSVSIEMAARELRYAYFERLISSSGFTAVAVAHHKNDAVETVLLNLIRGTGIGGLKGISPRNGHVVRPLLAVTRVEIEHYLAETGQDFITDSTNLIPDVKRNIVRLKLLPLLRELNPAAEENISRLAGRVEAALELLSPALEEAGKRVTERTDCGLSISIPELKAAPAGEIILWNILKDYGFTSLQTERIYGNLSAQTGKTWRSATHTALVDRNNLIVAANVKESQTALVVEREGTYEYGDEYVFDFTTLAVDGHFQPSKDAECISVDADKAGFPLTVRTLRRGERFIPFGMTGEKLVSDFLTDRRISLFARRRQLVIADRDDRIVWLAGLRTDNRFRISAGTRRALIIRRKTL